MSNAYFQSANVSLGIDSPSSPLYASKKLSVLVNIILARDKLISALFGELIFSVNFLSVGKEQEFIQKS